MAVNLIGSEVVGEALPFVLLQTEELGIDMEIPGEYNHKTQTWDFPEGISRHKMLMTKTSVREYADEEEPGT